MKKNILILSLVITTAAGVVHGIQQNRKIEKLEELVRANEVKTKNMQRQIDELRIVAETEMIHKAITADGSREPQKPKSSGH